MTDKTPTKAPKAPPPPKDLGAAGAALWRQLHTRLRFEAHELAVLHFAARQADDVRRLEDLLAEQGPVVAGSQGQPRLSPVLAELRQSRLAVGKLLGELRIPDDENSRPLTPAQRRAKKAAEARWAGREQRGAVPAR